MTNILAAVNNYILNEIFPTSKLSSFSVVNSRIYFRFRGFKFSGIRENLAISVLPCDEENGCCLESAHVCNLKLCVTRSGSRR